ncbi:TRNA (guanine(37)-N1)-methyltransferase [Aphelenchoides bicaudatus]|nr:TRNA (guanine(37)-N1)-methyltransferase [Aphelenchoides bicaudatus]
MSAALFRLFYRRTTFQIDRFMKMSTNYPAFMPPIAVRGMTEFDASKFEKTVDLPYIKIPSKLVGRVIGAKSVQEYAMRKNSRFKSVMNGEDKEQKLMFFDPDLIAKKEDAGRQIQECVKKAADHDVTLEYKTFTLTYEDWDVKRCLRAVLPEELDFSGHTQAGHILHLNLREEMMPYRFVIGRILLDKINYAKTVVNKLDQISSEFRFFELELLAGEPDYIATVSENGFKFKLDFSKVFWNSRLNNEHGRVIEEIRKQQKSAILFDVFAGVGPFIVPAAFSKNTVKAYANDLNPVSIEYMNENLKLNKAVPKDKVSVYNLDGAEFIRTILPVAFNEHCSTSIDPPTFHILMNLPALAVKFLPAFESALADASTTSENADRCEFIVYCYMFVKATEDQPESWFKEQAKKAIKDQIQSDAVEILEVSYVRNVAYRKNILMSKLLRCSSRTGPFFAVIAHRNFSIAEFIQRKLGNVRIPWEYLQVRRKLAEAFANRFHFERVAALGPDFACLEWLMRCGSTRVEMSDGTLIESQKQMREFIKSHGFDVNNKNLKPIAEVNQLDKTKLPFIIKNDELYKTRWSKVPPVYIKTVDASDSVIADPGFQYFQECYQIEKLLLNFCDFFGDRGIEHLCAGRAIITLKELEIILSPNLSDSAFHYISKLRVLQRAHFYYNPYVVNEPAAKQRIRVALPRCYITYPKVQYIGTGKPTP